MKYALVNATVLDGTGSEPVPGGAVLIDHDRIVAAGRLGDLPDEVVKVDLAGLTVMPGLIDAHIHLATWAQNLLERRDRTIPYLVAQTVSACGKVLDAGCTSARDCGGLDAGVRDAIGEGLIRGPRLLTSVTIVSPTDGLIDPVSVQGIVSPTLPSIPRPYADGPDAVRGKVREVLRAGADFIKIATSGGVSSPRLHPQRQLFTEAEVMAAVDEAHAAGVRVACHAIGGPGLDIAVRAGVDSIEHGALLSDGTIAEMARRGIWYVPTLTVYRWHETLGDAARQQRARGFHDAHRSSIERARAAGVPIAMGSDAGSYSLDFSLELDLLVDAGFTPLEAITAGTLESARCLGISDETGSIEPGKFADLLIVDGDPATDVQAVRNAENILAVFQRGTVVGGSEPARFVVCDAR